MPTSVSLSLIANPSVDSHIKSHYAETVFVVVCPCLNAPPVMQIAVDTISQSFDAGFTDQMWEVFTIQNWRHVYPFCE